MHTAEIIGYIAGTLTTACFIPQVMLVLRERKTQGISASMYVLYCLGVSLWLTYGIMMSSAPIIIFNAICLCLGLAILMMKLRLG